MDPLKAFKPETAHIHIDQQGIVELVLEDHAAIRQLMGSYQQLRQGSGPGLVPAVASKDSVLSTGRQEEAAPPPGPVVTVEEQKQELAWELVRQLSAHSVKEEMVLYPAVRDWLGDQVADLALKEHHELKVLLKKLDTTPPSSSEFDALFTHITEEATRHLDEEEREVLPLLQSDAGNLELVELGRQFHNAAAVAPTRPHPSAPTHHGPLVGLAAVAAKPLDAVKDAVRSHTKAGGHGLNQN